ncbi:MAG: hypothetical protein CMB31_05210 [Euryarchaeota archaeon]|nr:hypothetical protein [Euryarchaeota archaeon]|tara:strand:+ start:1079 stop:1912 length:834 start_codon:yes stop_codon:yes gene_type:complete
MGDYNVFIRLLIHDLKGKMTSPRMVILYPLLVLFILGSVWGFSDPNASLPGSISVDGASTVMFLSSLFVLLSATLGVVLVGFDSISRPRLTGELAIELAQPISRTLLGINHLFGVWLSVAVPVALLQISSLMIIEHQMGFFPSTADSITWVGITALLLLWYASLQMIASSMAQDLGSSVTFGVATWMLFTLMWLLVTVVIATILGVDATNTADPTFIRFQEHADLFSPNGVYQLVLQNQLPQTSQPTVWDGWIDLAVVGWTVIPTMYYLRRFRKLKP